MKENNQIVEWMADWVRMINKSKKPKTIKTNITIDGHDVVINIPPPLTDYWIPNPDYRPVNLLEQAYQKLKPPIVDPITGEINFRMNWSVGTDPYLPEE